MNKASFPLPIKLTFWKWQERVAHHPHLMAHSFPSVCGLACIWPSERFCWLLLASFKSGPSGSHSLCSVLSIRTGPRVRVLCSLPMGPPTTRQADKVSGCGSGQLPSHSCKHYPSWLVGPLPRRQALLCCAHVTVKTAPESLSLSEATTAGQEDVTALSANPSLSLKDAPITIKMTTVTKMIMMCVLTI